jgi:hypothetical protein
MLVGELECHQKAVFCSANRKVLMIFFRRFIKKELKKYFLSGVTTMFLK